MEEIKLVLLREFNHISDITSNMFIGDGYLYEYTIIDNHLFFALINVNHNVSINDAFNLLSGEVIKKN